MVVKPRMRLTKQLVRRKVTRIVNVDPVRFPFAWQARYLIKPPGRPKMVGAFGAHKVMSVSIGVGLKRILNKLSERSGLTISEIVSGYVENGISSESDGVDLLGVERRASLQALEVSEPFDWLTLDDPLQSETIPDNPIPDPESANE